MTPERPRPILSQPSAGATDKQNPAAEQPRRSFAHQLKDLFGKLAEAITGKPTPTAARRRKRRDETGRAFAAAARKIIRRAVTLPAAAYAAAVFLSGTLDWLNPWHHETVTGLDESFPPPPSDLYPHL